MNPAAGVTVEVMRAGQRIMAGVRPDPDLGQGVVAMSHAWSSDVGSLWIATNNRVVADRDTQSINRMPVMTGLPVTIYKVAGASQETQ